MALLEIKNLEKRYGGIIALNNISFSIPKNTILSIIGPNGAGKTTVFNLLTGFHRADSGSVLFNGQNLIGLKPHQIAKLGIIRTFQAPRIFPKLTVWENLMVAARYNFCEKLFYSLFRTRRFREEFLAQSKKASYLLDIVRLQIERNSLAKNLSYGQQRLLELARIMMSNAEVLLLDEPTAGVHPVLVDTLAKLIWHEKTKGKTIVIIEHNIEFTMKMSDQIVVLNSGRKIAEGKPKEIQNNEAVIKAYLGERFGENASGT